MAKKKVIAKKKTVRKPKAKVFDVKVFVEELRRLNAIEDDICDPVMDMIVSAMFKAAGIPVVNVNPTVGSKWKDKFGVIWLAVRADNGDLTLVNTKTFAVNSWCDGEDFRRDVKADYTPVSA